MIFLVEVEYTEEGEVYKPSLSDKKGVLYFVIGIMRWWIVKNAMV